MKRVESCPELLLFQLDLILFLLVQRGKKVACGSSEGTIYLFNWDGFGATSDRFAVKAESIDCMVPVTENVLCTGSIDGVIRLESSVTPPSREAGKGGLPDLLLLAGLGGHDGLLLGRSTGCEEWRQKGIMGWNWAKGKCRQEIFP